MPWISVRNWRKFQHYDPAKRRPVWIKQHLELLAMDEYRGLSAHQRAVLHGLWLEYASSRCQLLDSTSILSSRLALRVARPTLDALNHAGFIDIVASKELADGYHVASLEVEVEVEKEKTSLNGSKQVKGKCPRCGIQLKGERSLAEHLYHQHDGPEPEHWLEAEAKAEL